MIKSSQHRSEVPQFDLLGVDDLPVYVVDPGRRQICTTKTNSLHLHQGLCEDVSRHCGQINLRDVVNIPQHHVLCSGRWCSAVIRIIKAVEVSNLRTGLY